MKLISRRSFVALAGGMALSLAGCGSDDEESASDADDVEGAEEEETETETDEDDSDAEEQASDEAEEVEEVPLYSVENDDFIGELAVEFVEVTDEGVVFSFTTTIDMAYLDMTLISVEGTTYRPGDVYDSATDSDDYEFGIFEWSDNKGDWICGVPAMTLYADETELYMFSWPENVEFETMTIYCSWSEYFLNSSGAVTRGPYTFEGYTITFTRN